MAPDIHVPPHGALYVNPCICDLRVGVVLACWYVGVSRGYFDQLNGRPTGREQTLLQTLILPVFVMPTLLPTPLLEPRYFLIPYMLLRCQVGEVPKWGLALEWVWYAAINGVTMYIFLYHPREGVGRFMW